MKGFPGRDPGKGGAWGVPSSNQDKKEGKEK